MTCADTQGRWPCSTLPPGAPVSCQLTLTGCLLFAGEQGAGALGVPPAALMEAVHPPPKPTLLQDSAGGCPFSPWLSPQVPLGPSHLGCPVTTASSRPHLEDPSSLLRKITFVAL